MQGWTPLRDVAKFQPHLPGRRTPGGPAAAAYAPPSVPRAHEIDYRIEGEDLQFVEIELDPGESVVAEAGALMYMTAGIQMETIFGDGSGQNQEKGLMGALLGAGKRMLTGESLFMTVFTAQGGARREGRLRRALSRAHPAHGPRRRWAASSSARRTRSSARREGVSIGIAFQKKIGVGLFGGEGFIMQRLRATAWPSSTPAACSPRCSSPRARRCASTPAASWPSSPRSTTTSSSWAA